MKQEKYRKNKLSEASYFTVHTILYYYCAEMKKDGMIKAGNISLTSPKRRYHL
jgi:hypothetical protein